MSTNRRCACGAGVRVGAAYANSDIFCPRCGAVIPPSAAWRPPPIPQATKVIAYRNDPIPVLVLLGWLAFFDLVAIFSQWTGSGVHVGFGIFLIVVPPLLLVVAGLFCQAKARYWLLATILTGGLGASIIFLRLHISQGVTWREGDGLDMALFFGFQIAWLASGGLVSTVIAAMISSARWVAARR